jgi:DNA/RNA-binding domain of Phe-tRNA-synthetase-like protein
MRRLRVDPAILERFPGYTAAVVYARDLENGESDAEGAAGIRDAEDFVRANLKEPASAHPHLHAWRNAFSAFGAKPSKFLCSAEALVKRVLKGEELPAINRVVDAYNAVSLRHVVPAGGEDLDRLESDLELTFSDGTEPFDLLSGDGSSEHPERGEVVWKDSAGVTCRRWNWRQCRRTRLLPETKNAYFVIDRMAPYPREELDRAAVDLIERLRRISPGCDLELETFGNPR